MVDENIAPTLRRFNRDTWLFVRVYAFTCFVTRKKKSRATTRDATRNFLSPPLPFCEKTTTTSKCSPLKNHSATLPSEDLYLFAFEERKGIERTPLTITLKITLSPSCFGARHEHSFTAGRRLRWIHGSSHFPQPIHSRRTFLRSSPILYTHIHTRAHTLDFFAPRPQEIPSRRRVERVERRNFSDCESRTPSPQ